MKVAVSPAPVRAVPAAPAIRQRLADYVELTKPRVQSLLLFTTVFPWAESSLPFLQVTVDQ